MATDTKPRVRFSPRAMLTHSEAILDFENLTPDTDVSVNIVGPTPQPYWAMLKTDRWGNAQLIWRTQAAGDYHLKVRGDDVKLDEDFSVRYQAGEEDLIARGIMQPDRDNKTVEEPGKMGDTPSAEMRAELPDPVEHPELNDPAYQPALGPTETEPKSKARRASRSKS